MWIAVVVGVALLIAILVIFVATRPSDFRISRSTTISAPRELAFAAVNDFHHWEAWSPWAKLDPQASIIFEGPDTGLGATFRWAGNKEVGEGNMTITESRPNERIRIRLEFLKPFAATNTAEFTFVEEHDRTVVTWSMFGTNSFIAKAVSLFMDCEKMVGGQFEQGLANMKSVVQAQS